MEKKNYVTPQAVEEAFVANCYVAKCNKKVSVSTSDGMRCANPSHTHFKKMPHFTTIWVEATTSDCKIKVGMDGIGKTAIIGGDNFRPAPNATVYGEFGETYICTETYKRDQDGITYYVPANLTPCYGTYVNTGSYGETDIPFS